MIRKILPLLLALGTGLLILAALRPPAEAPVVVAARALPAGHILAAGDLAAWTLPADRRPTQAFTRTTDALGQTLAVARSAGDWIGAPHLGLPAPALGADERALAVRVTDATGLAGLLQPGQHVGVAAVLLNRLTNSTFAKATVSGLRVLYVPPVFRAATEASDAQATPAPLASTTVSAPARHESGVVVLAVPIGAQAIPYETLTVTASLNAEPAAWWVSPLELLTALNASPDAVLTLYLEPEHPAPLITAGLTLETLLLPPASPTPAGLIGGVK